MHCSQYQHKFFKLQYTSNKQTSDYLDMLFSLGYMPLITKATRMTTPKVLLTVFIPIHLKKYYKLASVILKVTSITTKVIYLTCVRTNIIKPVIKYFLRR